MPASTAEQAIQSLVVEQEQEIAASAEIVFESILEQLGPESHMPDGSAFPMKLEAWPGGRWYRDLGNNAGHLWAHVQVIKPPKLLELHGPLFMSYAAISHVQYRLTAEGQKTRLKFTHQAIGLILPEHSEGVRKGWAHWLQRIQAAAQQKAGSR